LLSYLLAFLGVFSFLAILAPWHFWSLYGQFPSRNEKVAKCKMQNPKKRPDMRCWVLGFQLNPMGVSLFAYSFFVAAKAESTALLALHSAGSGVRRLHEACVCPITARGSLLAPVSALFIWLFGGAKTKLAITSPLAPPRPLQQQARGQSRV
jgi:hypothetical protein